MFDLKSVVSSLTETENGLWVSQQIENVSYPSDRHQTLAELEDRSFWFAHRGRVIGSLVGRFPPPGCIFDVGGGNGFMVRELRSRGHEAILVEPGRHGALAAIDRGLQPVVNATLASARFDRESLPAVGLFDVLEHIEDDHGFLVDLHGLVQQGGRIYLTVPAYQWLWSEDDVKSGHFRRYTATTLRRALERAGFEVEYWSYFFTLLPIPILALRTLPTLLGMRRAEKSISREHAGLGSELRRTVEILLNWELRLLERFRAPFGSSLSVVARKDPGPTGTKKEGGEPPKR